jgi:dGTPase
LIPNKTGDDIGFERHPLAYLVEAADDICYTIIDFEELILDWFLKILPWSI